MDQSTCRRYHKSKKPFLYVRPDRTTPLFGHWKPAPWYCRSATNQEDKMSSQCILRVYVCVNLTIINPLCRVLLALGLEWKRSRVQLRVGTSINYRYWENFLGSFEQHQHGTPKYLLTLRWTEIVHKRDFVHNNWLSLRFLWNSLFIFILNTHILYIF